MTYLILFILFVIAVSFLKKFNQGQVEKVIQGSEKENSLKAFALALGLQYEEISNNKTSNTIYDQYSRVWGVYQTIPIEIRFGSTAKSGGSIGISYNYTLEKTITFSVNNPQKKSFDILPKSTARETAPTGNANFDAKLSLIGDQIIPNELLEYFGKLGWMHLTLREKNLTFHDTFYEQFQGIHAIKMMKAIHPIWKSTPQDQSMNVESGKEFLTVLVEMAKKANLV